MSKTVNPGGERHLFTLVMAYDKPGDATKAARSEHMKGHLDYMVENQDKMLVAGPIFAEDNKSIIGSLLIYKTEDQAEARAWLEADPYYGAGFWDKIVMRTFRGAIGSAVGGVTW